mmetsp:Transcript_89103/g.250874  ORF Transcript_89103/g.250874 Transcript_89103/m.250874 type:complete len:315 (+) Transcript_89103:1341-2285(+)
MRVVVLEPETRASMGLRLRVLVEGDVRLRKDVQRSSFVVLGAIGGHQSRQVVLALRVSVLPVEDVAQVVKRTLGSGPHLQTRLVQLDRAVKIVHLALAIRCAFQGLRAHGGGLQHLLESLFRLIQLVFVPPAGSQLQQGGNAARLLLERQLKLFPPLPDLAISGQEVTINDSLLGAERSKLLQPPEALQLGLRVGKLPGHRKQFLQDVRVVRVFPENGLQRLLRFPWRADLALHFRHQQGNILGLLGARAALQCTSEVMERLARASCASLRVELPEAQAARVVPRPDVKRALEPRDRLLIPARFLLQSSKLQHH